MAQKQSALQKFVIDFVFGGVSAAFARTACSPIEVVRTRLQVQHALLQKGKIIDPYRGIADCFRRLYLEEGWRTYYKGNMANVVRYIPTQAGNLAFKDLYTSLFIKPGSSKGFWSNLSDHMMAAGAAGATTQVFVHPVDYSRVRLTNDIVLGGEKQFRGIWDCMKATYLSDGFRGLYRGFLPSIMLYVPYRGCQLGLKDGLKPILPRWVLDSLFLKFCINYAITVTAATLVYPLDTIRKKMMMSSAEKQPITSWVQCCRILYEWKGLRAFYGGVAANAFRSVCSSGVITLYDQLQKLAFGKVLVPGKE